MVVSIGNIMNKFFLPSTFSSSITTNANINFFLPTMFSVNDIGMDSSTEQVSISDFEVRGRIPTSTVNLSRESLMAFSGHSTLYHDRIDINIDCSSTMGEPTSELFYETEQENALQVSMVANQQEPTRPMDSYNETPSTHVPHEKSIINIQLLYDTQAPTEPELWSGSFHPISLHKSIEHFASDTKNIKVTLDFLAKYIKNKQVNDLNIFNGIDDTIWNFISLVYEAK